MTFGSAYVIIKARKKGICGIAENGNSQNGENDMALLRLEIPEEGEAMVLSMANNYELTPVRESNRARFVDEDYGHQIFTTWAFSHPSRNHLISFATAFGIPRWLARECSVN